MTTLRKGDKATFIAFSDDPEEAREEREVGLEIDKVVELCEDDDGCPYITFFGCKWGSGSEYSVHSEQLKRILEV